MGKLKFGSITEVVKWIVRADTLEPDGTPDELSGRPVHRGRFGEGGFLKWLFSPETLIQDQESSVPLSRWGRGGFLGWLFSPDEFNEEPVMKKKPSRFGEAGFARWLTSPERLDEYGADNERTGRGMK